MCVIYVTYKNTNVKKVHPSKHDLQQSINYCQLKQFLESDQTVQFDVYPQIFSLYLLLITHIYVPTVVIWNVIRQCDMDVHISHLW